MERVLSFVLCLASAFTYAAADFGANDITHFDINSTIAFTESGSYGSTNYYNSYHKKEHTLYHGKFYFVIRNHGIGTELWSHDPTTNDETLIQDINLGVDGSSPKHLTVFNEKLYFSAYTKENGRELWAFDDGTNQATLVKDLAVGVEASGHPKDANPTGLFVYNNALFFFIDGDSADNNELWRYQPGGDVFTKILDSNNTTYYSKAVFDNKLYLFYQSANASGFEPDSAVIYNDTTSQIENITPSQFEQILSHPHIQLDSKIYTGLNGQLVTVDVGSKVITPLLNNYDDLAFNRRNNGSFTFLNGSLYIELADLPNDVYRGIELYRYNISEDSLALVVDFDDSSNEVGSPKSTDYHSVFAYNDKIYFTALGRLNSEKLWSYSDETEQLTKESKDTDVNTLSSNPRQLTLLGDYVYFVTEKECTPTCRSYYIIWRLNLTDNTLELVKEIQSRSYSIAYPETEPTLFTFKGKLGYSLKTLSDEDQLWLYDSQINTHELIYNAQYNSASGISNVFSRNDLVYFLVDQDLTVYDSETGALKIKTTPYLSTITQIGEGVYFTDSDGQIWFHDSITKAVTKFQPENFNESDHSGLTIEFVANNKLYLNKEGDNRFFNYDPQTNQFGDTIIEAPAAKSANSRFYKTQSYQYENVVYFSYFSILGHELYAIDLNTNTMKLTANIHLPLDADESSSALHSSPTNFFELGQKIYFSAIEHNPSIDLSSSFQGTQNAFWQYSPIDDKLKRVKIGGESDAYEFVESLYYQGKIISSGKVIKDGVDYGTELFIINVNNAPIISISAPQSADESTIVTLDASNSNDEDGDELTYQWQQTSGISVSLIDANTELASFTAPATSSDEVLTFELVISDGIATVNQSISVTIINTNTPPTVSIGALQDSYTENQQVSIIAQAVDSDELSFSWQQLSGVQVTLTDATSATLTIDLPDVVDDSIVEFMVTVSDGEFEATATVSFTISNVVVSTPDTTPTPVPTPSNNGGGAVTWLLLLMACIRFRTLKIGVKQRR